VINNSRCLCDSRLHSHLRIQRDSRPSSVWETNEETEEVTYESDSREGGQEEGEERRRGTNKKEEQEHLVTSSTETAPPQEWTDSLLP
jgi:hypothetical protein